jgi:putative transposase
MIELHHLSERRACCLAGLSRDSYRHPPAADQMTKDLSGKIVEIAHAQFARRTPAFRLPCVFTICCRNSLANGRRIKCLRVADHFSHECVDLAVDWGISGLYVTRLLDRAATFRGYPLAVHTDNGPEFTSRAFMGWAHSHGIRHILMESGRPMQNGYIESFNGKFRDECLNEQWCETLHQAKSAITAWRKDYNEVRPHSSVGRIPPARFAELPLTNTKID